MSAPVDSAHQGDAAGTKITTVASPKVEKVPETPDSVEGSTPVAGMPPVATAAPSAASSVASKHREDPVSTARSAKKSKKSSGDKIGKGRCVYCMKQMLFHIVLADSHHMKVWKGLNPGHRLFGTVKQGSSKHGYNVEFDIFPHGEREVMVTCKQLTLVLLGANEKEFQYNVPSSDNDEEVVDDGKKKKMLSPEQESIES